MRGLANGASVALCALGLFVGYVVAGNVTPPAGPVAGTMKTLAEVEPRIPIGPVTTPGDANSLYRIDAPGSYYLTGNITGIVGMRGIEIASDNLTIDLMGYTLQGVAGSLTGIATDGARSNITIRNGVVTGWSGDGIDLTAGGFSGGSALVESIHASANGVHGIRSGRHSIVRDCAAELNGNIGIIADDSCTIERCVARSNGADGFHLVTEGAITGCSSSDNSGNGFYVGAGGVVSECMSSNNTVDGYSTSSGVTITGCSAYSNDFIGIDVSAGSTVVNCTSYSNAVAGIEMSSDCLILNNTVDGNQGSGIHGISGDCRIEGNIVTDNPIGIELILGGNLVIRNSAAGNTTNYDLAANNKVGVIIAVPNSAAILGSTGGAGVGTSDPWANFSF